MIRLLIAFAAIILVPGCDFGEQRPLNYKKGEYLGTPHQPLEPETLQALKVRVAYQGDVIEPSKPVANPPSVRPPGQPR